MSHLVQTLYTFAEAGSAISLPLGGGLAAYAKFRRNAQRDRRAREETARIAAERAARTTRENEHLLRDQLIGEKDDRIRTMLTEVAQLKVENERLHNTVFELLRHRQD